MIGHINTNPIGLMPLLHFGHLHTLSDSTGILQHASGSVPNRHHGYCTDDNARALIVGCLGHAFYPGEGLDRLVSNYLGYLHYAWSQKRERFANFMSYDRRWLDTVGSEDAHGRAVWGLGVAVTRAPNASLRRLSLDLLRESFPAVVGFTSPRAWAYALLGLVSASRNPDVATAVHETTVLLAERINRAFIYSADGWPWCENSLTYDNAILPWSLLVAGRHLGDTGLLDRGLLMLDWLFAQQELPSGNLSIIGNNGWMVCRGDRAAFDQQPLDAASLLMAAATAFEITRSDGWSRRVSSAMGWFLGENDAAASLIDQETGGCHDGLSPDGPNRNQGAESTIAWLMARLCWEDLVRREIPPAASYLAEAHGIVPRTTSE